MAQARAKIGADDARRLILARLLRTLHDGYDAYLRRHRRDFVAAVENLWDKYAVTARDILAERDRAAAELAGFLAELGYEWAEAASQRGGRYRQWRHAGQRSPGILGERGNPLGYADVTSRPAQCESWLTPQIT